MKILIILQFIAGLLLLIAGAELIVRNAARLASDLGISPVVVGLTVVAFGTSAPELAISIQSALRGAPDIALGNVIGSNIANILLILGLSASIVPLIVAQQLIRFDVPVMIGASLLVYFMALNGFISRMDGLMLASLMVVYLTWVVVQARKEKQEIQQEYASEYGADRQLTRATIIKRLLFFAAGLVVLVVGAQWLVSSSAAIARTLGVSELVIGLTIVAVGTSAPEIATSLVAALRGERDIAVGNVVGSNIFNLMFVLATTALIAPSGVAVSPAALAFDLPFMVAVAVACLPTFFTGGVVARWEGILFIGYYATYILFLLLAETHHQMLPQFSMTMLVFVIPLTLLGLVVSVIQEIRRRRTADRAAAS